jgi:hypothetical protein
MKKYLIVSFATTLIIIVCFLAFYYYQESKDPLKVDLNQLPTEKLIYKDFIEIDSNLRIIQTKPEKLTRYTNDFFQNILIPKNWSIIDNKLRFFTISNNKDFIYYRKFFIKKDELGNTTLDINKSSNYLIEASLGRTPTEDERIKLEKESLEVNKSLLQQDSMFNYNFIEELSVTFTDPSLVPIQELNVNKLLQNYEQKEIDGIFSYKGKFEGNNRIVHEFYNESKEFLWIVRKDNTIIYSYGFAEDQETVDLLKILFLNLD